MPLKLNKQIFARNHKRENEIGDIFNKTSNGITNLMPFIIPLFFAPVLITTSFFSKEIILMWANISLCIGYVSSFAYRIYNNEVSKAELLTTALIITAFVILTYFLYPAIALTSFINVLGLVNQVAAAVNLFFVIKHVVIPPCKQIIERVAKFFGFDIAENYYTKAPLTLKEDRFVLDKLLQQTYNYDSFSPEFKEEKIESFNKLLNKLCQYINKYDESVFGYIVNKDAIADLESQINLLTTQGSPDSSYTFIRKKIGFKTTKIKMLETAKEELLSALKDSSPNEKPLLRFFIEVDKEQLEKDRDKVLTEGLECLQKEIDRQQGKIDSLRDCLPHRC